MLVQHSFIKDSEIHAKIGGDHGGGSFRLSYQIANVPHPNSTDNTVVFSIFEAKDYRSNIKIGLSRFREQINALQTMKWRWVMQYILPLFQEERNYPTSNTWLLINFLAISSNFLITIRAEHYWPMPCHSKACMWNWFNKHRCSSKSNWYCDQFQTVIRKICEAPPEVEF